MKKSRFTEEQILYALRQVEAGTSPADICRQLGCSEASLYIWKKRYGNLSLTEVKSCDSCAMRTHGQALGRPSA
jgi:putative transposase